MPVRRAAPLLEAARGAPWPEVARGAPWPEAAQDGPSRAAVQDEPLLEAAQDEPSRAAVLQVGPRPQAVRTFCAPGQMSSRSSQPPQRREEML